MWIGVSAASGRLFNIPVMIRQMTFYLQSENGDDWDQLMGAIDFLLTLDAGNHPSHPTGIVATYHNDWWTMQWESNPEPEDVLNAKNLYEAVLVHRQECQKSEFRPTLEVPSRHLMPPSLQTDCLRCAHYRLTATEAINHLEALRNRVQALESELENTSQLRGRQASAFHRLYEKALSKEALVPAESYVATSTPALAQTPRFASDSALPSALPSAPSATLPNAAQRAMRPRKPPATTPQPSGKRTTQRKYTNTQLVDLLRERYDAERIRLEQHPSLKWTWGVDVLQSDIADMFRAADRDYKRPHTGYDSSLPGDVPGEMSVEGSTLLTVPSDLYIPLDSDNHNVPELSPQHIPHHFLQPPLCLYRTPVRPPLPDDVKPVGSSASGDSMINALHGRTTSRHSDDSMINVLGQDNSSDDENEANTANHEDNCADVSDDSMIGALHGDADDSDPHDDDGSNMSPGSMINALRTDQSSAPHTDDDESSRDSMLNALYGSDSDADCADADVADGTKESDDANSMLNALYGSDGSTSDAEVADGTNEADSMINATTGNSHRRRYASDSFDGSRGLTQSSPVLRPIDRLTPLEEDHSQFLLIEEASDDEPE